MQTKPLKILQASAGSGKTFSLTAHYLTLLFTSETKYREILAVTFTNKATEEMKSRILETLQGLALGDEKVAIYRKIILSHHPDLNPELLQQKAYAIYRRILHDYSRFSISTIDGFVQKVIRSFTFELGLDAGYKLEMNLDKVKRELAVKLNEQLEKKPELLQWIINLALERIRDNKSWNYRDTLLSLADEIFKERYQPFENAIRTLNPDTLFKDLQEVTKNIISFFEGSVTELAKEAVQTFRSSGVLIDQLKGKSRSPLNNLTKIADGDFAKIEGLQKLINEPEEWQKGGLEGNIGPLYAQLNPLLDKIYEFYREEMPRYQMAKALDANIYYLRLMQEMAGLMKEYREESSSLLISDAQNLLKGITAEQLDNPSFIWEKVGNRFRHFLFDEFQDTSSFQWTNFLPLLKNAIAEANGKLTDHLIVGDVKQSIYRWRNGDWRILHSQAKKHIGELQVLDDSLKENYRSTENIIDFNNFLFKHAPQLLQNHINAKVVEDGGQELFNSWWQKEGYNNIICSAYEQSHQEKAASTLKGGTVEIDFIEVTDNRTRASESKEKALEVLGEKIKNWLTEKKYKEGEICVLVRSNTEARDTVQKLMSLGISVISGEALYIANNSAVKLIINTFYAMVARKANAALYLANCVQLYNNELRKPVPAEVMLKISKTEPAGLKGFLPSNLCDNWFIWQQLPLFELTEKLIAAYSLSESAVHLPYLLAFRDMVSNFARQGERGIFSFLDWWEEEGTRKALPSSESSNSVQVMTIHKSKGLAFDVVMIPFCGWSLDGMPNSIFWVDSAETPYAMLNSVPVHYKKSLGQSAFSKAYFEELLFNYMDAINMLYVATTRTRKHLYISAPGQVAGKDEQCSLIGDLIFHPLKTFASQLNTEFNEKTLLIDAPVERPERKENQGIAENKIVYTHWEFKSYPLSNKFEKVLIDDKVYEQLDLLSGNVARKRGVILHEILSRVTHFDQLKDVVAEMQLEGLFRKSDEAEILALAESVLLQPDLKALLDKPYKTLNEQTIIGGDGHSYRPDKVLIGDEEAVLIDFKFTEEPKPQHYEQVVSYRDLLTEMGYKNIKSYLYYGFLQELRPVH